MVVACEYSVLSTWFKTCPSYFTVHSDFSAQCSMLTYIGTSKQFTYPWMVKDVEIEASAHSPGSGY